jgi:GNAT superfamily N-acetyltransferase
MALRLRGNESCQGQDVSGAEFESIEVVRLDENDTEQLSLIATHMRATLVEVLGQDMGESMYSFEWLKDRARSHVDGRCLGAIFIAQERIENGNAGHIIVRQELDDHGPFGLVSTIYVLPECRRHGVARRLVDAAHHWFQSRKLHRWATDTSETNFPLIRLFNCFGYKMVFHSNEQKMVRLMKAES